MLVDPALTSGRCSSGSRRPARRVIEGDEPCVLAKACKNPVELTVRAMRSGATAPRCRFLCWLEREVAAGTVTEIEAAARLEEERRQGSALPRPSFETISVAGANAALPHYRVTEDSNRAIEAGLLYLVDLAGSTSMRPPTSRARSRSATPAATMCRRFTLVLKGHIAIARALFPAGERRPARQLRAPGAVAAGLDFDHGTGHGIGSYLCVHEGPQRIAKTGTVALKPGMIVSNEPGYYRAAPTASASRTW